MVGVGHFDSRSNREEMRVTLRPPQALGITGSTRQAVIFGLNAEDILHREKYDQLAVPDSEGMRARPRTGAGATGVLGQCTYGSNLADSALVL